MKKIIAITLAAATAVILAGCGESKESKRNLEILAREAQAQRKAREEAEAKRKRQIEEARKWHRIQMEVYERSMTPEKKK